MKITTVKVRAYGGYEANSSAMKRLRLRLYAMEISTQAAEKFIRLGGGKYRPGAADMLAYANRMHRFK